MSNLTDKALFLLRAVPEVALDREWVKGKLMADSEGAPIFARAGSDAKLYSAPKGAALTAPPVSANTPRECAEVSACCTIGWIELAAFCASGADPSLTSSLTVTYSIWQRAIDIVTEKLIELEWAEEAFRLAWEQRRDDDEYGETLPYEVWRDEIDPEEVGEEGLLAFWNDRVCEGKEQSLELIVRAAESR